MSQDEAWSLIKGRTKNDPTGKQVYTSLLGKVYGVVIDASLVGIIPYDLRVEARQHGFRIVWASVQDGTYTLEKICHDHIQQPET